MSNTITHQRWVRRNKEHVSWYKKEYYKKNKEAIHKYKQRYYLKHKTKRLKQMRSYTLKRNFGLTDSQYLEILWKQNYKCAICLRHQREFKKSLAVDHCHKTNVIRGLLCPPCNKNIVSTFDSPLFYAAQRYMNVNMGLKISSSRIHNNSCKKSDQRLAFNPLERISKSKTDGTGNHGVVDEMAGC